jgi:hypothetical protein
MVCPAPFFFTPLLLLIAWWALLHTNDRAFGGLRIAGTSATLILTAFALHEFLRFRAFAAAIDAAIAQAPPTGQPSRCPRSRSRVRRGQAGVSLPAASEVGPATTTIE